MDKKYHKKLERLISKGEFNLRMAEIFTKLAKKIAGISKKFCDKANNCAAEIKQLSDEQVQTKTE